MLYFNCFSVFYDWFKTKQKQNKKEEYSTLCRNHEVKNVCFAEEMEANKDRKQDIYILADDTSLLVAMVTINQT